MKKILIINSSYRKKNTFTVLQNIKKILSNHGYDIEVINLKDYKVSPCYGCEYCIYKNKCNIDDDMEFLMKKLEECDGIVIGTPVYINNMSGNLKTFLDRTCRWFHRPVLEGKPVILVATTAGSGLKNTFRSLEEGLVQWGVDIVSEVGRTISNLDKEIEKKEILPFIKHLNTDGMSYSITMKQITTYQVQRALANNIFEVDKNYWKEKCWIDKIYYRPKKVGVIGKVTGSLLFNILVKNIKPVDKKL
ncbi:hypothetical protein UT300019_08210 [Clostridium sp. CTA-19]